MRRFKKETNGYYFINSNHETIHIFKIPGGWGWCIDHSMTKGHFKTLKDARAYFA